MFVTNTGKQTAVFRDDAGKHYVEPWQSIELSGDQHLPAVLAVKGMVEGKVTRRKAPDEEQDG